jgi:adenosine 3'-phospho 5'-phosphosulfate transporter B2
MAESHRLSHHLRICGLFSAITACFLVYSLIQERLMTTGFGPERERFRHSLFIILVNRLVTCAVAAAALSLLGKTLQPAAPLSLFAIPSLANVISSASQYEALKYVSFPLQALAKCAKTVSAAAVATAAHPACACLHFSGLCRCYAVAAVAAASLLKMISPH